jgi:hypothetical protein
MANVRVKIYLVNWVTDHDGIVENGCIVCMSMVEAQMKMKNLFEQSVIQTDAVKKELSDNNYYTESGDGILWERAEILEQEIGVDVRLTY